MIIPEAVLGLITIAESLSAVIILIVSLVALEVIKRILGWHRPHVNFQPVLETLKTILEALKPIAENAQKAAYAHGIRNGGGRPSDVRNIPWEEQVLRLLTDIRDALLRKGVI